MESTTFYATGSSIGLGSPSPNINIHVPSSNKIRDIKISELEYGYLVEIGCSKFAISDTDQLIKKLSDYIKDPEKTEMMWNDGKFLKTNKNK